MRQFAFFVFVLTVVGVMDVARSNAIMAAEGEVTGTWKIRLSFGGRGGRISILKVQKEGDKLTGVMLSSQGGWTEIEDFSYKDGKVSFQVTREWDGRRFTTPYTGKINGDTIKGTTQFQRRGTTRTLNWEATRTSAEEFSQNLLAPLVAADIDLVDENLEVWRNHILPDSSELQWQQIPWLTTFKDGILAADNAGKPLLLWTMNGHPLGCT